MKVLVSNLICHRINTSVKFWKLKTKCIPAHRYQAHPPGAHALNGLVNTRADHDPAHTRPRHRPPHAAHGGDPLLAPLPPRRTAAPPSPWQLQARSSIGRATSATTADCGCRMRHRACWPATRYVALPNGPGGAHAPRCTPTWARHRPRIAPPSTFF